MELDRHINICSTALFSSCLLVESEEFFSPSKAVNTLPDERNYG
jgi:hypothetical protein